MGSMSDRVIEWVKRVSARTDAMALQELLDHGRSLKPPGTPSYDKHYDRVRELYQGKQISELLTEMKKHYPKTFHEMSPFALNVVAHAAMRAAQVYKQPWERWIEIEDAGVWVRPGATIEVDGEMVEIDIGLDRQEEFAETIRDAYLHMMLVELERRVRAAKTMFLRARWATEGTGMANAVSPLSAFDMGRRPHVALDAFWPSDVVVIPHEDLPGKLWAAHAVIARVGPPVADNGQRKWQIWSRAEPLGPIKVQEVQENGDWSSGPPRDYGDTIMPWCVLHDSDPEGCIYLDRDRYMADVQIALNERLTDWLHSAKHNSHGERYAAGRGTAKLEGADVVGGPNAFHLFDQDVEVGVLSFPFSTTALDGVETLFKMLGLTLSDTPDAWNVKGGNPPTGVAKDIANQPSEERRTQHVAIHDRWEREELLPLIAHVHDRFSGRTKIGPCRFGVRPPKPRRYMDPLQKVDLGTRLQAAGYVSPAMAAVIADGQPDVETAVAEGLSPHLPGKEPGAIVEPQVEAPPPAETEDSPDGPAVEPVVEVAAPPAE